MPWLSIFSFLLTFFLSKKSGKSTASSLLTGAAVGLGTYYLVDPSNADNLFKIGVNSEVTATPAATTVSPVGVVGTATHGLGSAADLAGKTVDATGKVLTSWGPTGTAAVVGTTALATNDSLSKYIPWILLGVGALVIFK